MRLRAEDILQNINSGADPHRPSWAIDVRQPDGGTVYDLSLASNQNEILDQLRHQLALSGPLRRSARDRLRTTRAGDVVTGIAVPISVTTTFMEGRPTHQRDGVSGHFG
jgi:hypothetical protein